MILCPMPRTILVVDDDPHIRQLLVFALGKAGLDTVEADDGEAALRAAGCYAFLGGGKVCGRHLEALVGAIAQNGWGDPRAMGWLERDIWC